MASLVEQIFAAMPLTAAALATAREDTIDDRPIVTFQETALGHLVKHCWELGAADFKGAGVSAPTPAGRIRADANNPEIAIWGYRQGATPNVIENLSCRVVSDGFRRYTVCDEIRFGRILPPGTFKDSVVVRAFGKDYELPLSEAFRLATFRTQSGLENRQNVALQLTPGTPLVNFYPLEATYDESTVHAFVYDLPLEVDYVETPDGFEIPEVPIPAVGPIQPPEVGKSLIRVTSSLSVTDPKASDRLRTNLDKLLRLRRVFEMDSGAALSDADGKQSVRDTILADDDWRPIPEKVWAETNGPPSGVAPIPARVLVLVSLAVCREKDDFTPAPGGVLKLTGMGRFYPQIVVKATIPLEHVDTAVRLKRPPRTTIEDGLPCGCVEMKDEIFTGLFTDRNEVGPDAGTWIEVAANLPAQAGNALNSLYGATVPNWSFIFDYRTREPVKEYLGSPIVVVDPRRNKVRTLDDAVERNGMSSKVKKLRREGAFDNIHCAPRMKFPPGTRARIAGQPDHRTGRVVGGIDVALEDVQVKAGHSVDLLDVVMAPFCAHDCFHLHWRWTDTSVQAPQMGWSETAPFCVPGGTMIPHHHRLQLLIEGPAQFALMEDAWALPEKPIPADTFEIFYSFGAAFALSADTLSARAIRQQVEDSSPVFFVDPAKPNERIKATNSWTAFYVKMQYYFEEMSPGFLHPQRLVACERLRQLVPLKTLSEL
jgi:hypothetical protein